MTAPIGKSMRALAAKRARRDKTGKVLKYPSGARFPAGDHERALDAVLDAKSAPQP